jgi:hypothetical protein
MVKALVIPLITYCAVVWMTCGSKMQTKIQRLHNRAAKLVLGKGKFTSSSEALSLLSWHPIKHQWELQSAIMMYKCMHNIAPLYLSSKFQESFSLKQSTRFTRAVANNNLMVPYFRLEKGKTTHFTIEVFLCGIDCLLT